jgi:hypothetical protein
MLDLGAKQVCNEINFVQLIDVNEKEKVQRPPPQIKIASNEPLKSLPPLGTSDTMVTHVSPSLECVVEIQSSKQQLENFGIVAEVLKDDNPLIGVSDVAPAQTSSVPKVTPPIRKIVHTCPPTSHVQDL